jgi:hypothetical protein
MVRDQKVEWVRTRLGHGRAHQNRPWNSNRHARTPTVRPDRSSHSNFLTTTGATGTVSCRASTIVCMSVAGLILAACSSGGRSTPRSGDRRPNQHRRRAPGISRIDAKSRRRQRTSVHAHTVQHASIRRPSETGTKTPRHSHFRHTQHRHRSRTHLSTKCDSTGRDGKPDMMTHWRQRTQKLTFVPSQPANGRPTTSRLVAMTCTRTGEIAQGSRTGSGRHPLTGRPIAPAADIHSGGPEGKGRRQVPEGGTPWKASSGSGTTGTSVSLAVCVAMPIGKPLLVRQHGAAGGGCRRLRNRWPWRAEGGVNLQDPHGLVAFEATPEQPTGPTRVLDCRSVIGARWWWPRVGGGD